MNDLKKNLFSHMNFLCNRAGERHQGSKGEKLAADYIAEYFKKSGYEVAREKYNAPGWNYGNYFIKIEETGKGINCFPCYFSPSCDVKGKITVIKNPNTIKKEDVSGRICFYPFKAVTGAVSSRNELAERFDEMGADVLIVVGHYQNTLDTKTVRTPNLKRMAIFDISYTDAWKLMQNKEKRFHIKAETTGFEYSSKNIIARVKRDSEYKIVFGAHYDTAPGTVGAGDNASGTATLLEMARLLKDVIPKGIDADFVAFGAEEFAALGSFKYTRMHRNELDSILWMCNIDNIGSAIGQETISVGGSWRLKDWLQKISENINLGFEITKYYPDGDNVNFGNNQIPTFWFRSNVNSSYTHIHSPEDNLGKINFGTLEKTCAGAIKITKEIFQLKKRKWK